MAPEVQTFRLELTANELEAVSWAVWFAAPAAMTLHVDDLDTAHQKLIAKRRQMLQPGPRTQQAETNRPEMQARPLGEKVGES
jgi:hypothetical protein